MIEYTSSPGETGRVFGETKTISFLVMVYASRLCSTRVFWGELGACSGK